MSLMATLKRLLSFGGSGLPTTEEFQRVILLHVSMQGPKTLAEIGQHTFPHLQEDLRRYGLVEAAQILVNRNEISAAVNGSPVDPVNNDWTAVTVAHRTR